MLLMLQLLQLPPEIVLLQQPLEERLLQQVGHGHIPCMGRSGGLDGNSKEMLEGGRGRLCSVEVQDLGVGGALEPGHRGLESLLLGRRRSRRRC